MGPLPPRRTFAGRAGVGFEIDPCLAGVRDFDRDADRDRDCDFFRACSCFLCGFFCFLGWGVFLYLVPPCLKLEG